MTPAEALWSLDAVARSCQEAGALAARPTVANLDASGAILESAARRLAGVKDLEACRGDRGLLSAAQELRGRVRHVARLMASAAAIHAARQKAWNGLLGGYTAEGLPTRWAPAGRISVRI